MKKIIFISALLITSFFISDAQGQDQKSRKEIRKERETKKIEEVRNLIMDSTFVFNATHAMPLGGGSIHLNYSFDAEINKDTIVSYLPFYGVAYRPDYGGRNSAFDFIQPIENYKLEKDKNGYMVTFEVKNKMDHLDFTFRISELGYANLNIISTNRQAMSFYGIIEAPSP
jgi:hypothetical protein